MAGDSQTSSAYEVVLADLRAKRDELNATIAALEKAQALAGGVAAGTSTPASGSAGSGPKDEIAEGAFLGLSIVDASKKLLEKRRRQMGTQEVTEGIQAGGVALTSENPANVVGSVLNRYVNATKDADIVRVGRGMWALAVWYSNPQRFRTKPDAVAKGEDEPEGSATPDKLEPLALDQSPQLKIVQ